MVRLEHDLSWPRLVMVRLEHVLFWPRLGMVRLEHDLSWPRLGMVRVEHDHFWPRLGMVRLKHDHFWPGLVMKRQRHDLSWRRLVMPKIKTINSLNGLSFPLRYIAFLGTKADSYLSDRTSVECIFVGISSLVNLLKGSLGTSIVFKFHNVDALWHQ